MDPKTRFRLAHQLVLHLNDLHQDIRMWGEPCASHRTRLNHFLNQWGREPRAEEIPDEAFEREVYDFLIEVAGVVARSTARPKSKASVESANA